MLLRDLESELFSLNNRTNDVVLGYFIDELLKYGLNVYEICDCDVYIYLDFIGDNTHGELKIDRFRKEFSISSVHNGYTIIPVSGDWPMILKYLDVLINDSNCN